jgi:hypothetical protein
MNGANPCHTKGCPRQTAMAIRSGRCELCRRIPYGSIVEMCGTMRFEWVPKCSFMDPSPAAEKWCAEHAEELRASGERLVRVDTVTMSGVPRMAVYVGNLAAHRVKKAKARYKKSEGLESEPLRFRYREIHAVGPVRVDSVLVLKKGTFQLSIEPIVCRSCGAVVYRDMDGHEFRREEGGVYTYRGRLGRPVSTHSHCCQRCLPGLRAALHENGHEIWTDEVRRVVGINLPCPC